MNKLVSIGITAIMSFTFLCCGTSKTINSNGFQSNPPFKVVEATYTKWLGGQPGVNGILISIEVENAEIELDSVYFRNKKTKLKLDESSSKLMYVGSFALPNTNRNLQLDIDPKQEYGNQTTDILQKIPFQLKEDEAVVSYLFKNKRTYFKISNIIEIDKN